MLDEPTNDLDLETLDLLQEVIADYDGTVLIVSHDRDFLDRTVTVTLGLDGSGKVDIVAGGYEDWAKRPEHRRRSRRRPGPRRARQRKRGAPGPRPSQGSKLTYKDQRDLDRLPGEIERMEAEIAADEDALHDPDLYTRDPEPLRRADRAHRAPRAEKEAAEERWLEVAEMAEALSSS